MVTARLLFTPQLCDCDCTVHEVNLEGKFMYMDWSNGGLEDKLVYVEWSNGGLKGKLVYIEWSNGGLMGERVYVR